MDDAASATQTNQTCVLCTECPGFEPHFWKQSTCAKCKHPISDHNWKKYETSSLALSAEFPEELYKKDDEYRVILYNDENITFDKVITQIKTAFKKVANQKISSEDAEELATSAHMNGGTCIFTGSESKCWEFKQILSEISLGCEVETPNNIVIHDTNENSSFNRLLVLHYTTSHGMTLGTLLTKLCNALGFNKEKAKYICNVTAIEGKINLYCGPLHQCVLISRLLKPLKTTIQDINRMGLSLCDQAQLVLVKRFTECDLSLLPMEVADSVFHLAFVSGEFKLKLLQHYLSTFQIRELNLCANSINHEESLPCVTDEWLDVISKCATIQSLNLNFCCSKVSLNGLHCLSSLNIVSLSLENCNLSDLDVSKFPGLFPFLKHLSLAHSKRLTTQCAPCFEQLHALESLNIQHTSINVSPEYLKQKMPQLVQIGVTQEEKTKKGRTAQLFAEAFDRIRDKLPNQREVGEEHINMMFGNELRLMLAQNPGLLQILVQDEEEEDQDDEESDSEEESDME